MFNSLAREFDVDELCFRPSGDDVQKFFEEMCSALPMQRRDDLDEARKVWTENGGDGDLNADLLPSDDVVLAPDGLEPLPNHSTMAGTAGKEFRLHSRAFMLTFHCIRWVASLLLWEEFKAWVEERCKRFGATHYSCTLEESKATSSTERVHAHCYFSWHGAGSAGVDHTSTKEWRFQGIHPRVDKNTDHRGPWFWLRSVQHGHFYVSIIKEGTLHAATDYAPWGGEWVPEAAWVTALWKQHKLGNEAYLELSVKLRDGHDRRKACVESVIASEAETKYAAERAEARKLLAKTAKPFKPLPDKIQVWRLQYDEVKERYTFLALFGPSCTGKSRLARYLFGDDCTLVIDVQHADHPDMRKHNRKIHRAVLMDEVSSPKFAVANKKLLQAHVDGARLGQSATQLFAYEVFLWRTPIMLTTNNWKYDDFTEADKNWIDTNCVAVHIQEKVFVTETFV